MALTIAEITDPFHRELYKRLHAEISGRMEALAGGSATKITEDQASTAEKYAAAVSYIRALNDALAMCEDIEQRRNIKTPENKREE